MSSSRSDPMSGHAMVFVAKAKSTLTTEEYNEFLRLLYNYQRARRIDIGVFKQGVFQLLKEHKDLISRTCSCLRDTNSHFHWMMMMHLQSKIKRMMSQWQSKMMNIKL